jgi:hypothetical protein
VATDCDGVCRDLAVDPANCGACGAACDPGERCSEGECALSCGGGLTDCDGVCRDLDTDRANCGACSVACDRGEICEAGECALTCPEGLEACDDTCADLAPMSNSPWAFELTKLPPQTAQDEARELEPPVFLQPSAFGLQP